MKKFKEQWKKRWMKFNKLLAMYGKASSYAIHR